MKRRRWHNHLSAVRYLPIPLFFIAISSVLLLYSKLDINSYEEQHIRPLKKKSYELTNRVKLLFESESKGIIGRNLNSIKKGSISSVNVLTNAEDAISKSPMKLEEIFDFLTNFLHKLHAACARHKAATFQEIWNIYHDLAMEELYPWDREYLRRMPERRRDGTIFLGIAVCIKLKFFSLLYHDNGSTIFTDAYFAISACEVLS